MKLFTTVSEIQNFLKKQQNKTIGFIPTMGALHKGHLSLVQKSKNECDITVVSIFVNPTQFEPNEDLDKYPRPIEKDQKLLEKEKVDVLFLPSVEAIYPNMNSLSRQLKQSVQNVFKQHASACCDKWKLPIFTTILEGATRPTHFLGVAEVVKRLFEIIQPTDVFFGQKDYQQTLVIKWLIQEFKFKTKLQICPIIREKDGLALSSRNQYLNSEERETALILKATLDLAISLIKNGEKDIKTIELKMRNEITKEANVTLDYAVIRNKNDLSEQKIVNKDSIALIAVKVGKTRLIDNTLLPSS